MEAINENRSVPLPAFLRGLATNSALVAMVALFLIGSIYVKNFLTMQNFSGIFYQYAIIGFLALGQLLVILTAGIDLSQGSMVAFTSIVVALLMQKFGIGIAVDRRPGRCNNSGTCQWINGFQNQNPPFRGHPWNAGDSTWFGTCLLECKTNFH